MKLTLDHVNAIETATTAFGEAGFSALRRAVDQYDKICCEQCKDNWMIRLAKLKRTNEVAFAKVYAVLESGKQQQLDTFIAQYAGTDLPEPVEEKKLSELIASGAVTL
jgi:hypothetical protein